jgi:hypothetical protein
MGVDLDDMNGAMIVISANARNIDRMITAQNYWQGAARQYFSHRSFGIDMGLDGISMNDVGIADVGDSHLVARKILDIVLMIIGAAMAERKQRRGFSDGTRSEVGASAILAAHIEGNAKDGSVDVDRVPIRANRPFPEATVADEG